MRTAMILTSTERQKMRVALLAIFAAAFVWPVFTGCAEVSKKLATTWHDKCRWLAGEYFNDAKVVSLCHAIEANDLAEMNRLIAAGADVNAKGEGNMTPLLWAFPDNKLNRFKLLLEHGADPNVIFESDFNSHGGMSPGGSVTHLAAGTSFAGYFEAVFEHGGDPNLIKTSKVGLKDTPLFTLINGSASDKSTKIQLLIDRGVDLDHVDGSGMTPVMQATGRGHYNLALKLLEAGADPHVYQANQILKLTHVVVRQETRLPHCTPAQKADYKKLVDWLNAHGESIEEAKADEKRWESWGGLGLEKKAQLMDAEKKARLAREAREKAEANEK